MKKQDPFLSSNTRMNIAMVERVGTRSRLCITFDSVINDAWILSLSAKGCDEEALIDAHEFGYKCCTNSSENYKNRLNTLVNLKLYHETADLNVLCMNL